MTKTEQTRLRAWRWKCDSRQQRARGMWRAFHHLTVARSSVHRVLVRHGMDRLAANQKHRPHATRWQR